MSSVSIGGTISTRVCALRTLSLAAVTIQGWCSFHLELLIVRLLFGGGDHSREASNGRNTVLSGAAITVLGCSEYLDISGYTLTWRVQCACAHLSHCPGMFKSILGSWDASSQEVGVIFSNKCCYENHLYNVQMENGTVSLDVCGPSCNFSRPHCGNTNSKYI